MNKKYERYIEFIVSDLQPPYFKNMREMYGLRPDEYEMVLSKLYEQPVRIKGEIVYDNIGNVIYREDSDGNWYKQEYDSNNKIIYSEYSDGYWYRREYDTNGNIIYWENSDGIINDNR